MKRIRMKMDKGKTFKEGFEDFLFNCKARGLREGTINHYEQSYIQLIKYIGENIEIAHIDKSIFDSFIVNVRKNKEISSQTLFTYARDLKTIINFYIRQEYCNSFKMELPKVDKQPIATYTDEELEKLLKKPNINKCSFVEYRNYVMVAMFLSTGIRLSSLINIRVKDINFDDEVVNIMHTKNRKSLIIPLNKQIMSILKEYLKYRQYGDLEDRLFCNCYGKPLNKSSTIQAIASYNRKRGVETTSIHKLRHTFAKKWVLGGNSIAVLQKILGHSSLQITQNYLNVLISDIKAEVDNYNILQEFNSNFIKLKKKK
ncbi:integrase/recombinase XerD [Clostridium sp. DSM 8431]|uniref:tyrosine-type recombinase/integrase n=1 Tax=Clostridium sp. DSM 8431 TaxID=1761781 RepID=UPI0008DFE394|nr:tyrosine-type recombinase/integrase [Clostridium sp. DSM 8431]SFU88842.1 integrase/recombinase XerD [Clostridium sp. DSM 8431]